MCLLCDIQDFGLVHFDLDEIEISPSVLSKSFVELDGMRAQIPPCRVVLKRIRLLGQEGHQKLAVQFYN